MRNVRDATMEDIIRVCGRLRPEDRAEQFARLPHSSGAALADLLLQLTPLVIGRFAICTPDGEAQTILAAYRGGDGLAQLHRISTDRWDDVSRTVFVFGVRHFVPEVLRPNARRAECSVMTRHTAAGDMLRRLGFRASGIEAQCGRGGEEFTRFVWTSNGGRDV
ncbi:hypothetical protein IP86_03020 [Rhodopseudomonas sp. AAP120]|uniref:hypothetical protein n=1 Tax=Rhodopseudomonas sp. AAP120 TaxID=1523430 RepID=UPI0006BA05AA|nr:hypothetical protein [Rhodopseudomonas sp. AAP120]KPG01796.1 hypothetical protein IP86_03020 [Rhodopseudomonas sp. AAP120]